MWSAVDPKSICSIATTLIASIGTVVIGGYVGKFVYIFKYTSMPNTSEISLQQIEEGWSNFWSPDGTFWIFGLLTLAIVMGIALILNICLRSCGWTIKQFVCCRPCRWLFCNGKRKRFKQQRELEQKYSLEELAAENNTITSSPSHYDNSDDEGGGICC